VYEQAKSRVPPRRQAGVFLLGGIRGGLGLTIRGKRQQREAGCGCIPAKFREAHKSSVGFDHSFL
jgi:hypothetical protein